MSTDAGKKPRSPEPLVETVRIRNYKSIGGCDVSLGRLTVLVGRNGAGKSNFLDAMRFVKDALQTSLDHAMRERGGIDAVRRRSTGHPRNFAVELRINISEDSIGTFAFEIASRPKGGYVVKQERLRLVHAGLGHETARYAVSEGQITESSEAVNPPAQKDRLYLVAASGLPTFRPAYDALLAMGFYNLNPAVMKEPQSPDAGELLHRDGSNIASVVARLKADAPGELKRVWEYLDAIVPGIQEVARVAMGPKESLEFRQRVRGAEAPWRFQANNMSDGTLRALGALVAATQLFERTDTVRFVGIEEPETALHPAAAGVLMDALREASARTQILVTTHSDDLLEHLDLETDALRVVQSDEGTTEIGEVDEPSRKAIREYLYTAGEMLRMDQLEPSESDLVRQRQGSLFETLKIDP